MTLILVSWALSLYFNTTPLTLLAFGKVDNVHAPKMINVGDCCPPILRLEHQQGPFFNSLKAFFGAPGEAAAAVNVSVLLLAAINKQVHALEPFFLFCMVA